MKKHSMTNFMDGKYISHCEGEGLQVNGAIYYVKLKHQFLNSQTKRYQRLKKRRFNFLR